MTKVLTAAAVEKLKPGKQRREVRDGGAQGLHLIVQPSGSKSWALRYRRPNGKPAKLTLGSVDLSGEEGPDEPALGTPLTLKGARALAAQLHRDRARGVDIAAHWVSEKARLRDAINDAAESSYPVRAKLYIDEYVRPKLRRWKEAERVLGFIDGEPTHGGLAVRWRDRSVKEITAADIWAVVEEARRSGIPGLKTKNESASESRARILFAVLSGFFNWLMRRRMIDINPCRGLHRPEPSAARDRVLTPNEIRWFWKGCDAVRHSSRS